MKWTNYIALFVFIFFTKTILAQSAAPIIFIVDASGSMWGQIDGKPKMDIAKNVLNNLVENMGAEQSLGLVAYGHRQKGDCLDVEYMVPASSSDNSNFKNQLFSLKPLGKTPLAYSAKMVIDDLRKKGRKATVILLTDGIETCDGDLCELIKAAKKEGIDFKMHIVGFDLKPEEKANLKCAAEAGDGNYLDAANAEELTEVLDETTQETIDSPPANCLMTASKNGELIDAYVKITNEETGEEMRAQRTYSDTADFHLPAGKYVFKANVLGIENRGMDFISQNVTMPENTDTPLYISFSFDAGRIFVLPKNNGEPWDCTVKVFSPGETRPVTGSRSYQRGVDFELNAGTYDIEILPLRIDGAELTQRKTVTVQANESDTLNFKIESGEAWIGASHNGTLVDATVNIISISANKSVGGSRTYTSDSSNPKQFLLLQGEYKVVVKALSEPVRGGKKEFNITVKAGEKITEVVSF